MRLLLDIYRFTRFSAAGASLVLPLLGAGAARRELPPRQLARLLGVAAAFHIFAYVDNDLCDLELDRGQPLRAAYPLVRGAIGRPTARMISLAAVAATIFIEYRSTLRYGLQPTPGAASGVRRQASVVGRQALTFSPQPSALSPQPSALSPQPSALSPQPSALSLAFVLMALYNRYGKRCPLPPLTDAIQGLGWAALIAYGAEGRITRQVALLMLHELLLILLVNGVHGPLRDLANDAAAGARTTAIWFGAHVDASGALHVPPALGAYAIALQVGMAGSLLAALSASASQITPAQRRAAMLGLSSCLSLTGTLLGMAARTRPPAGVVGMLHLILILSAPVAFTAPVMPTHARSALLIAHTIPLLANGLTFDALRWVVGGTLRYALRATQGATAAHGR